MFFTDWCVLLLQVGLRSLNLGICPKLNVLVIEAPQMASLELKGCGVVSEATINCPLLTSLDASFCRFVSLLPPFLLVVCSIVGTTLFSVVIFYCYLAVAIYLQPTEGWLLIRHNSFMPSHWVARTDVMPISWFWWTLVSALATKFDLSWFIIHFLGNSGACFRVMFTFEGNLWFDLCSYILQILSFLYNYC